MLNKSITSLIHLIFFCATMCPCISVAQVVSDEEQQVSSQEIFANVPSAVGADYGPDPFATPEELDINAIDSAVLRDVEGGKQLIDLDIRSRPVYRYDHIIQPKELIDNRGTERNSHLPKIYTHDDMKRILFDAIASENIPVLQRLYKDGELDFKMTDSRGNTLLDYAVKNKKYAVVKFLMYNKIFGNNTRLDYIELALRYADQNLIDLVEGVSPYYGDRFNETHVIRAMDIGFDFEVVSDIYDELDDAETFNLFNYYSDNLHAIGLEFMGVMGYDLNRKTRTGKRVMEYGIVRGLYNKTDQLMWLKKYFSHNHVYSAYKKLAMQPQEDIKLAPQLASYGFNYDLTHDVKDMEYIMICEDEVRKFDLDSRRKINTESYVSKGPFMGSEEGRAEIQQSYYTKNSFESSDIYVDGNYSDDAKFFRNQGDNSSGYNNFWSK